MKILVDFEQPRGEVKKIILDNGEEWILEGECNRCGECCKGKMTLSDFQKEDGTCKHLRYETINGKELALCTIMWARPSYCMLFPRNPYDKLPEKCGYRWKRVK